LEASSRLRLINNCAGHEQPEIALWSNKFTLCWSKS
jgi:hypothetical protein